MALQDGIYEIISAPDANKAIDVYGQTNKSATNIWLYTRNHTAAQKWAVISRGDYYILVCVLTGRRMDAAGNNMKDGTNVWQYDVNHTHAQHWDIVADGKTLTVDGKSYPTYVIKSDNTNFAVDVTGGSSKSQTNIQLYTANGTDAQRFAFVPVAHFDEEGTYKIVPANNTSNCLDVAGNSMASGANVQVYPNNDTSAQRWILAKNADDGTVSLINTHSQKAVDDKAAGTKSRTNAQIYTINGTAAQKFLIEPNGAATYDNQTVQTYRLTLQAGSQLCLDVAGGGRTQGTNVWFYEQNDTQAQQWALIPATAPTGSLPTPSALRSTDSNIGNGMTTANFAFSCNWLDYQMRVRFNTKTAAGWSGWSNWKNAFDGIGGNAGWGPAWQASLTYSAKSNDAKTVSIPIPDEYRVNGSTVTALRIQAELRSFGAQSFWQNNKKYDYAACSNAAGCDVTYYWKPTMEITGATLTGTGLDISYTSDLNDGSCDVTVTFDGHSQTKTGLYGGSGTVEIPCDKLIRIPTGKIKVCGKMAHFIESDEINSTVTVQDAPNRSALRYRQDETYYGTQLIELPSVGPKDTAHVYIVSDTDAFQTNVREQGSQYTTYECVAPLNKSITALIWLKRSDGTWDDEQVDLEPIKDHSYSWTFDSGGAVLDLGSGRVGATQEDSVTRKAEDYEIVGRKFHSYRLHKTRERNLSVTGALMDDTDDLRITRFTGRNLLLNTANILLTSSTTADTSMTLDISDYIKEFDFAAWAYRPLVVSFDFDKGTATWSSASAKAAALTITYTGRDGSTVTNQVVAYPNDQNHVNSTKWRESKSFAFDNDSLSDISATLTIYKPASGTATVSFPMLTAADETRWSPAPEDLTTETITPDTAPHGSYAQLEKLLEKGHATFRNQRGEILQVVVTGISKPITHVGWTEVKVTQYQESR